MAAQSFNVEDEDDINGAAGAIMDVENYGNDNKVEQREKALLILETQNGKQIPQEHASLQYKAALYDALLYLIAWSTGYASAQCWYAVTQNQAGMEFSSFVTLGKDSMLNNVLPSNLFAQGWGVAIGLNIALALLSYVLVKWQFKVKEKSGDLSFRTIFVMRFVDSFADGATFFSANLVYVLLISLLANEISVSIWSMFLFSSVLSILCVILTVFAQVIPQAIMHYRGKWNPHSVEIVVLVNDWFVGQWCWLMGFAWWTFLMVPIGHKYLNVYKSPFAWWILVLLAFVAFNIAAWATAVHKGRLFQKRAHVLEEESSTDEEEEPKYHGFGVALLVCFRKRGPAMIVKSLGWVIGIGLYFTTKSQFPIFDEALDLKPVSRGVLFGFFVGVVSITTLLTTCEQVMKQMANRMEFALKRLTTLRVINHILPERSFANQPDVYNTTNIFRPLFVCFKMDELGLLASTVHFINTRYATLRLTWAYVTGKALQGLVFGVLQERAAAGYFLYATVGVQAIAAMGTFVYTTYNYQKEHGKMCVCKRCSTLEERQENDDELEEPLL